MQCMARKGSRNSRRGNGIKKIEPSVQTMDFITPSLEGGQIGTYYIDLSQAASILNRRFYRQGLNWAVGGFKIFTSQSCTLTIRKAHDTWVTSGSWEKTMRHWLKQQNEAIAEAGAESAISGFRDYKVYLDDEHQTAGTVNTFDANLIPIGADLLPFPTGEWEPSQVVLPNVGAPGVTVEYNVTLYGGGNPQKKGAVDGYARSRAYPQSPDPESPVISAGWIGDMMDKGDDQDAVLQNATIKNDELPYDQAIYPGVGSGVPGETAGTSMVHDLASVTATTIGGITRMKGGSFPCGLIRLDVGNTSGSALQVRFLVELVPGTHRGYLAESMTEM